MYPAKVKIESLGGYSEAKTCKSKPELRNSKIADSVYSSEQRQELLAVAWCLFCEKPQINRHASANVTDTCIG